MTKKKFPLKYYLADLWDGKNILVDEVIADVKQIHADGNWPEEAPSVGDMVTMIKDRAPEYALCVNQRKHGGNRPLGGMDYDVNHWILMVADPVYDPELVSMNELRSREGLPRSCMFLSNIEVEL